MPTSLLLIDTMDLSQFTMDLSQFTGSLVGHLALWVNERFWDKKLEISKGMRGRSSPSYTISSRPSHKVGYEGEPLRCSSSSLW
jgi:hypothetical protein